MAEPMPSTVFEVPCPTMPDGEEECTGLVRVELEWDEGDMSVGIPSGYTPAARDYCSNGCQLGDADVSLCEDLALKDLEMEQQMEARKRDQGVSP